MITGQIIQREPEVGRGLISVHFLYFEWKTIPYVSTATWSLVLSCCVLGRPLQWFGFGHLKGESHSVMSVSLQPHGLYSPWNSPGQNTGVGSLSLLQVIFPTQGSNPGLPHCRWILYQLSHQRSPRILEWVAYPFSSGSSQPRNGTGVSCIAGIFFTNWAMREALGHFGNPNLEVVRCG